MAEPEEGLREYPLTDWSDTQLRSTPCVSDQFPHAIPVHAVREVLVDRGLQLGDGYRLTSDHIVCTVSCDQTMGVDAITEL